MKSLKGSCYSPAMEEVIAVMTTKREGWFDGECCELLNIRNEQAVPVTAHHIVEYCRLSCEPMLNEKGHAYQEFLKKHVLFSLKFSA